MTTEPYIDKHGLESAPDGEPPASDSGRGDKGIPHYKVVTGRYKIYNGDGELIAGALTQHDAEIIVKALRRENGWEAMRSAIKGMLEAYEKSRSAPSPKSAVSDIRAAIPALKAALALHRPATVNAKGRKGRIDNEHT